MVRAFAVGVTAMIMVIADRAADATTWTEMYLPYNDTTTGPFGNFGPYEFDDPLRQHLHLLEAPSNESQDPTPVYFHSHPQGGVAASVSSDDLDIFVGAGYSVISWESVTTADSRETLEACWSDFELVWQWFQSNAAGYNLDPDAAVIGGRSRGSLCSWRMAHSQTPGIRGLYMYNALPDGAWDGGDGDAVWVEPVTAGSPPAHLVYGPECPKPIEQNCVPSPNRNDMHNPRHGQTIVDRYTDLGMTAMITLTDGLTNSGTGIYDLFPSFAASLPSDKPVTSPAPSEFRTSNSPTKAVSDRPMDFVLLPTSTTPGGRCMDGTQAGYYVRNGTDPDLFVVDFRGGGSCSTSGACRARNGTDKGSSDFDVQKGRMRGVDLLDDTCSVNPDFCGATAVHVPYCTGDLHRGTAEASDGPEWNDRYYMDGHLNVRAIVERLIGGWGLKNSIETKVLLTGGSAGGVGAFFNGDWVQERLPLASVKVAPRAGWMAPGALPDDLPEMFAPSNYTNFKAGTHGNNGYEIFETTGGEGHPDVWKMKDAMPAGCLDHFVNETHDYWWACGSVHNAYRYIRVPIFNIHAQFDSHVLFVQGGAPEHVVDPSELHTLKGYVDTIGRAHRRSFQQILDDVAVADKPHPDGVFASSCNTHGNNVDIEIDGTNWLEVLGDWFFRRGLLTERYRQVEDCGADRDGFVVPCNAHGGCRIAFPSPLVVDCTRAIGDADCLNAENEGGCQQCAKKNIKQIKQGGCATVPMGTAGTVLKDICALNYKTTEAPTPLQTEEPADDPDAKFVKKIVKGKEKKMTCGALAEMKEKKSKKYCCVDTFGDKGAAAICPVTCSFCPPRDDPDAKFVKKIVKGKEKKMTCGALAEMKEKKSKKYCCVDTFGDKGAAAVCPVTCSFCQP